MKVMPVSMMAELERPSSEPSADVPTRCGEIHIEPPEEIRIRPKGAGSRLCPCGAEEYSFVIGLPAGARISIAVALAEMRWGFYGLSVQ